MARPLSSWSPRVTILGSLGACALAIMLSIAARHAMPSGDYWVFLADRNSGPIFAGIWAQNEYHLMLLPRIVFVLDELAGWGGHFFLSQATALISLGAIVWAGMRAISGDKVIEPSLRLPLAMVTAAFTLSATHVEILAEPQKLWVSMATAGCVLTLHLTGQACLGRVGHVAFALAMLLIVAATLSGVVGLLSLPVVVLLVVVLRGGWARLAAVMVTSAIAVFLFFTHIDLPTPSGGLRLLLSDPIPVVLALGRFFGAPLARILGGSPLAVAAEPAASALGLSGVALAIWAGLAFLRDARSWAEAALWPSILALALIWGGSVSLRDAAELGPVLSRYDLIVSLFWAALVVLMVRAFPRIGGWPLACLAMLLLFLQVPFGLRAMTQAEIVAATRIALTVGVADPAIETRRTYTGEMGRYRPLLQARGLSPFDSDAARSLGAKLDIPKAVPACTGVIDRAEALPDGGLRLLGHGDVPNGRFPLRIIDAQGRLVGLGERWQGNFGLFSHAQARDGWLAYAAPEAIPPLRFQAGQDPPCQMVGHF